MRSHRNARYGVSMGWLPGCRQCLAAAFLLLGSASVVPAEQDSWVPVTGADELRAFMSGKTLLREDLGSEKSRGVYRADGTGTLYAWGTSFPRNWSIKGDDQICVEGEPVSDCYRLERSTSDPGLYRAIGVATGETAEIRVDETYGKAVIAATPADPNAGGPARPSADELALKLANPANPVMKIGNNFDYVTFDGDLPGADDQTAFRYVFLTVFPFKLANGNSILFRPGIPVLFNDPVPDGAGDFDKVGTDLGDSPYDLLYSGTTKSGTIWGAGIAGTLPTATDERLGKDLWGLGPEVMLGVARKWGVIGGVLSHQWDVAGSGDGDINATSLNYFYSFPLGGGWTVAAAPVVSYNHDAPSGDKLTLPLGVGVARTMVLGNRPWTFNVQYWYNAERPDSFAAEHTVRFSVLPVVSAPWNKGK